MMEKRNDVKMALTPKEDGEYRKFIKEESYFPAKIGYILLEEKPLHPGLLLGLLIEERFDDVGVFLVFRGGMSENAVRLFLEHLAKWDERRIDRAVTMTKNSYYYYSKFGQ